MRAHQFGHQRIEAAHHLARRGLIVLARGRDQRAGIEIISHVIQAASTLTGMTALRAPWLQIYRTNQEQAGRRKL